MGACVFIKHLAFIYAYAYTDAHICIQVFIIEDQCFWTLGLLSFHDAV